MGRDGSAEAMVAECEAEMATIGGDKLYIGHGRALLGTIAIRRGLLERAGELYAESLAPHWSVESTFDIAGSLAQRGFLRSDKIIGPGRWRCSAKACLCIAMTRRRRERRAASLSC